MPVHRYPQVVGLAVLDAAATVGGFTARLKWPNDVLVGEDKLAGILSEVVTEGDKTAVVVGCGINLNWNGQLAEGLRNAISADEAAGHAVNRDDMLGAILDACTARLSHPRWIADAYRMRCATIGQHVRIEREGEALEGRAVDVLDSGSLLVEADNQRHEITVGEAVHLRLA